MESVFKFCSIFVPTIAILSVVPLLQFGIIYPRVYDKAKTPVNRNRCTCECWDTAFKGDYEDQPAVYHHFYFNITWQSMAAWITTLIFIVATHESLKLVWKIKRETVNFRYLFLFLSGLHAHYYTWWVIVGYFNDDFYRQIIHQTIFSISEIYAAWLALTLATKQYVEDYTQKISCLASISFAHLVVGGFDQFFEQMVFGQGHRSFKARNLGFIIPDILGLSLASYDLITKCMPARFPKQFVYTLRYDSVFKSKTIAISLTWFFAITIAGMVDSKFHDQ